MTANNTVTDCFYVTYSLAVLRSSQQADKGEIQLRSVYSFYAQYSFKNRHFSQISIFVGLEVDRGKQVERA